MAPERTNRRKFSRKRKLPDDSVELLDVYRTVGEQINARDIENLTRLYKDCIGEAEKPKIRDGFTCFLTLDKIGKCDLSNFRHILDLLKIINRFDLSSLVSFRSRDKVCPDPVEEYLQRKAQSKSRTAAIPAGAGDEQNTSGAEGGQPSGKLSARLTCDVRLRVRAEYCSHESALRHIGSNKPSPLERQFDKFVQASTILKSRDLGSIICDIKFSELTYLDAFWRDYINGSLHEALKGVFLTESLKQAVHHEEIKLLVNVDEDDYDKGRLLLLENLKIQDGEQSD